MACGVYVAALAALVCSCNGASLKLPSYLKPCSRSDPKLNECALKNGIAAIPSLINGDSSLQIPVLEPLLLEQVKIDEGNNAAVKFTLTLNKAQVHGLRNAVLKDISIDLKNKLVSVKMEFKGNELQLDSEYVIDGKVLLLPITGTGDMKLILENAVAEFKTGFDLVKHDDGLEYIQLKDSDILFNIDRARFDFKNLFNGDKTLGDQMNEFLNQNWQDVYNEVKPAVAEVLRTLIVDIISKVATKVSYDNIFGP